MGVEGLAPKGGSAPKSSAQGIEWEEAEAEAEASCSCHEPVNSKTRLIVGSDNDQDDG